MVRCFNVDILLEMNARCQKKFLLFMWIFWFFMILKLYTVFSTKRKYWSHSKSSTCIASPGYLHGVIVVLKKDTRLNACTGGSAERDTKPGPALRSAKDLRLRTSYISRNTKQFTRLHKWAFSCGSQK